MTTKPKKRKAKKPTAARKKLLRYGAVAGYVHGPDGGAYKLPKPGGIIATVIETISRPSGASLKEIIAAMSRAFPDRKPNEKTAYLNANIFATKRERQKDGAMRYWRKGK